MAAKGQAMATVQLDEGMFYDLQKLAQLAVNATGRNQRWVRDVETHRLLRLTQGILDQVREQSREQSRRKLAAEGLVGMFGKGGAK